MESPEDQKRKVGKKDCGNDDRENPRIGEGKRRYKQLSRPDEERRVGEEEGMNPIRGVPIVPCIPFIPSECPRSGFLARLLAATDQARGTHAIPSTTAAEHGYAAQSAAARI